MTSGPSGPILQVNAVSHAFGPRQVLKDVTLEVRPGEVYALLGPNGAGKTTLARVICGRIRPASGEVRIAGRDPFVDGEARAALGLAPQALALYPQLTVAENLQTFASLAGLKPREAPGAVARAMAVTETAERAGSLVRTLSGGYQRRVNIAAAILAGPKLLVLDEPTVGVDMQAREAIAAALRRLQGDGVGVLLVTHDLDQAQRLADRVGFLLAGQKVLEGAPAALIAEAFGERMEVEIDVVEPAPEAVLEAEGLTRAEQPGAWACLAADGYGLAGTIALHLKTKGVEVREVRVRHPSLSQLFARVAQPRQAA